MWLAVLIVAFVLLSYLKLRYLFTRRPFCGGNSGSCAERRPPIRDLLQTPALVKYELKSLHVPKVTGWRLKFLIRLSFTKFGRIFVSPFLFHRSNLDLLEGVYLPEKPMLYPTPAHPPLQGDHSAANRELLNSLVAADTPSTDSFRLPTVADFIRAYKTSVCTPTAVAETVLDAIAKSNAMSPPLRGIIDSVRCVVLAMAAESTQRWKDGKPLSLLDGVPVAVKGEFNVESYAFHGGAAFVPELARGVPESALVRKLKEAGAVIIGISNLQEFGTGTLGSNPNKYHLTARNPYDPRCYAGGSSSGSAVSVAAGLCPVSLGSDGGGSIRIPSATCGVVGLKPTNRLMDLSGVLPVAYSVSACGPICSSVLDTAIATDILSREGHGEKNLLSLEGMGESRLDGLTAGIYWEHFEHADKEIVDKCKAAVDQLKSLGATIVEITIPELEEIRVAHMNTIIAEMGSAMSIDCDKHFDELNSETLLVASAALVTSSIAYINAQKQRARAVECLKYIFDTQKVDVIVTPATGCVAPVICSRADEAGVIDSECTSSLIRFSFLANLTGVPGLVLPVGYTDQGLPVGLQLMGRWYEERTLFKAAWALENSGAFPLQKPQVFYDAIPK